VKVKIKLNFLLILIIYLVSSRFSNKDSLNLIKPKPTVKKDKKTIVISAESFLEPKSEEKKEKESRGEDILTAINNLKSKDQNAYLPTTLPFRTVEDESKTLDLNESDLYLFQMPRIIPTNLEAQKKLKEEELEVDEPSYDQHGFLIKNNFDNVLKSLPKNSQLGKLKIYKSGKIKMQIGSSMFDITAGINCKFAQELGVMFPKTQEAFFLGNIREKKLIVTPELNI
jgi:hypothetical protein